MYKINHANIKDWAKNYDGPLFDGILCDPPYHLTSMSRPRTDLEDYDNGKGNPFARRQAAMKGFMGKEWDGVDENGIGIAQERGKKLRAELHYRWNGSISKLNKSIRTMTENRRWMEAVKKRDGKCLFCGSKKELEADHIKPLAEILTEYEITDREQARDCKELWNLDNGRTLCRKCHCDKDNRKYTPTGQGRRQRVYCI